MAVTITGNIVAADDDIGAPTRSITLDIDGTTISVQTDTPTVNGLTIPGTFTFTLSQP